MSAFLADLIAERSKVRSVVLSRFLGRRISTSIPLRLRRSGLINSQRCGWAALELVAEARLATNDVQEELLEQAGRIVYVCFLCVCVVRLMCLVRASMHAACNAYWRACVGPCLLLFAGVRARAAGPHSTSARVPMEV